MHHPLLRLRRALAWAELWPALRASLVVVGLFGAGLWVAREYAVPMEQALAAHRALGIAVFFASSAVAVLLPMLTNLPLLPIAVLAWGPGWTALILLVGWIAGAALSFEIGRRARLGVLRMFPSVARHARIERLIHPGHRMTSLVLLRMTFPVDVLSYALGLYSPATTVWQNSAATAIGATPFALAFAWFPTLPGAAQSLVFGGSLLAFVLYAAWVLRRTRDDLPQGS